MYLSLDGIAGGTWIPVMIYEEWRIGPVDRAGLSTGVDHV